MKPIHIGRIDFTNILPLYFFFDQDDLNVELISQVPTQLNKGMASGDIDMGPISSFAYAENQANYVLLPDLSISSHGPVRSIFLFTKGRSLKELDGLRIALTNTSATSIALLRILLEKFAGISAQYVTQEPNLKQMMKEADAALLIGDDALTAYWQNKDFSVYDLSEEWYKHTGHSMTFAVWAVRKEVANGRETELQEVGLRFQQAKDKGLKNQTLIVKEAIRRLGGEEDFWNLYFNGLCYDLKDKELAGLQLFYDYAYEIGLLTEKVEIELLNFNQVKR